MVGKRNIWRGWSTCFTTQVWYKWTFEIANVKLFKYISCECKKLLIDWDIRYHCACSEANNEIYFEQEI